MELQTGLVWSETIVHPPIVSQEDFDAVQATLTGRGDRHTDKTRKGTPKPYQLRGLLYCGVCDRRMQGQWVNEAPYYRCRFPEEYALANRVMHPRNVYLREDRVVPRLDRWLGRLFAPHNVDQTLDILTAAQDLDPPEAQALAVARRQVADCDRKLAQHRAALEAGADPALVAGWIQEELVRKNAAEHRLTSASVLPQKRLRHNELAEITHRLGDMVRVLSNADPLRKAKIYADIGLRLIYHPAKQKVLVTSTHDQDSIGDRFVSEGGLEPNAHAFTLTKKFLLGQG